MKKWKFFITFFKKLYDDHYTVDSSFEPSNFTFVKVNEKYEMELAETRLPYDIRFEHDFPVYRPELQQKGYHENSVFYHIYRNGAHKGLDYLGFIEYDHVLADGFTRTMQEKLDRDPGRLIMAFNRFSFHQLWKQGILMNPRMEYKLEGNPESKWNCLNVILEDYNNFFGTSFGLDDLARKDCFPICHAFLLPSDTFDRIMRFHTAVMDSGKVEKFSRHNWRANAILMERYLAVALALEPGKIDDSLLLEHRSYPIRVMKPDWFTLSLGQRIKAYLHKKL